MPRAKGTYVTLDRWVFELSPKLPGAAGVILERLSAQSNYRQKSLTVGQLCHVLPFKERALQNAVAYLVARGYAVMNANAYSLGSCVANDAPANRTGVRVARVRPYASDALATRTDVRFAQGLDAIPAQESEELNPAIESPREGREGREGRERKEEQIKTRAQKSTAPIEIAPSQESFIETNIRATASQGNAPTLNKVARRAALLPEMPVDLAALPGLPAAWVEWLAYRKQRRLATAPATVQGMFVKLREFHADGQDPAAVIHNSIANGWQGLFPLRAAHVVKFNPKTTEEANARVRSRAAELYAASKEKDHAVF